MTYCNVDEEWEVLGEAVEDDLISKVTINNEENTEEPFGSCLKQACQLELSSIILLPDTIKDVESTQGNESGTLDWALEKAPSLAKKGLQSGSKALLDELIECFLRSEGCTTVIAMSGGYTALITLLNMYSVFFRGRSKLRALKNVVDEGGAITIGNFVGYGAGVSAALLFNSLPTLGILGVSATVGFVASYITHGCLDKWTLKLFKLPENEELEKALNFLEVKPCDSNSMVNRAYRQKARRYHPDSLTRREPPLSKEEMEKAEKNFLKVQNAMKRIREAREEEGWVWLESEKEESESETLDNNSEGWMDKDLSHF
ncbi:unnamed protein product [Orchesella dallaii]|uniref:J domain-containing protein n=1 Tax=Orchesella dallaii TaxID=48710 RepID=A0ABP1S3U5_9HEXA